MEIASLCFNLLFFVSLGCLIREIAGIKVKNEFFCLKCSYSAKKI